MPDITATGAEAPKAPKVSFTDKISNMAKANPVKSATLAATAGVVVAETVVIPLGRKAAEFVGGLVGRKAVEVTTPEAAKNAIGVGDFVSAIAGAIGTIVKH